MRREVLLIFIIGVMTSTLTTEAHNEWAVDVGDSINFNITKSDLNVEMGSRNFDYSGMSLNYTKLSKEEHLVVQVTGLSDVIANYSIIAGNVKEEDRISINRIHFPRLIFDWDAVYHIAAEIVLNGDTSITQNYGVCVTDLLYPFFPSAINIKDFFAYRTKYFLEDIDKTPEANLISLNTSSESENEFMYEWCIKGIVDYTELYRYQFTNQAKFVYEKATGVLLACRLSGFVNGIIDGTNIVATMDFLIEQQDYTIPANEFMITYPAQINLVILSFVFGILTIQKIKGRRKKIGMK